MVQKDKGDFNELKEQLDKILERSKEVFSRGKDEVVRFGQVSRLRLEILNYERQQRQLFEELGRSVYKISKKKDFKPQQLEKPAQQLLDKIEKLAKEIDKARKDISALEADGTPAATPKKGQKKKSKKKKS